MRFYIILTIAATGAATVTTSFSGSAAVVNAATLGGLSGASNVFLGGVLAAPVIAVDAVSGAMLSLTPNPLEVTLTSLSDTDITPTQIYDLDTLSDGNDTYKKRSSEHYKDETLRKENSTNGPK